jgi:protease-4
MNEQNTGPGQQPQVLQPAQPIFMQPPPPPPKSGGGFLRALVFLFVVLGILAAMLIGGIYWIASAFGSVGESWIEETHYSGNRSASDKIAIVSVEGFIMDLTARHVIQQLKSAKEDDHVKAVILKVDSPGGTINASDHIHRRVKELCRGPGSTKPIVVSMQGLAASGGYYVSAPATRIFAERTTMTGSIGVIASFLNVSGMMDEWKVRMEVIKTGPWKDSGSPFRQMTDDERKRWNEIIGDAFQTFLEVVSDGRKMDLDVVKQLATGEVYTAREAKANGLIDEIGYLEDAIEAAKKLAGLDDPNVIEYKRPLRLSDLLLGEATSKRASLQIDLQSIFRANVPHVMYLTQGPTLGL